MRKKYPVNLKRVSLRGNVQDLYLFTFFYIGLALFFGLRPRLIPGFCGQRGGELHLTWHCSFLEERRRFRLVQQEKQYA